MKIKVSEATKLQLDWLVAKTQGESHTMTCYAPLQILYIPKGKKTWYVHSPTTNWKQGGPIIEREKITLRTNACLPGHWAAFIDFGSSNTNIKARQSGPTPLVAAMRCYVASELGNEVEIPEELI